MPENKKYLTLDKLSRYHKILKSESWGNQNLGCDPIYCRPFYLQSQQIEYHNLNQLYPIQSAPVEEGLPAPSIYNLPTEVGFESTSYQIRASADQTHTLLLNGIVINISLDPTPDYEDIPDEPEGTEDDPLILYLGDAADENDWHEFWVDGDTYIYFNSVIFIVYAGPYSGWAVAEDPSIIINLNDTSFVIEDDRLWSLPTGNIVHVYAALLNGENATYQTGLLIINDKKEEKIFGTYVDSRGEIDFKFDGNFEANFARYQTQSSEGSSSEKFIAPDGNAYDHCVSINDNGFYDIYGNFILPMSESEPALEEEPTMPFLDELTAFTRNGDSLEIDSAGSDFFGINCYLDQENYQYYYTIIDDKPTYNIYTGHYIVHNDELQLFVYMDLDINAHCCNRQLLHGITYGNFAADDDQYSNAQINNTVLNHLLNLYSPNVIQLSIQFRDANDSRNIVGEVTVPLYATEGMWVDKTGLIAYYRNDSFALQLNTNIIVSNVSTVGWRQHDQLAIFTPYNYFSIEGALVLVPNTYLLAHNYQDQYVEYAEPKGGYLRIYGIKWYTENQRLKFRLWSDSNYPRTFDISPIITLIPDPENQPKTLLPDTINADLSTIYEGNGLILFNYIDESPEAGRQNHYKITQITGNCTAVDSTPHGYRITDIWGPCTAYYANYDAVEE